VRRALVVLAVCCGGLAAWSAAAGGQSRPSAPDARQLLARGRVLFAQGCASCHGEDLRGRAEMGPSLRGAGAAAADFYLSTGRMPLADPTDEPERAQPAYPRDDIDALVAFVGSFGGPGIPRVDPARGSLATGMEKFTEHCAGCHQIAGVGGMVTGARVPSLADSTPVQVAEAVRIGPYLMPRFSRQQVSDRELDSIVRYVEETQSPHDPGGWAIGHLGPITEGLVAWLIAGTALLLVSAAIGARARR
jgi:quinol---cytochrome-c reductase cytochrome c subunit